MQYAFQYNADNLHAFSSVIGNGNMIVPIVLAVLIGLYTAVYSLAPHFYSAFLYRQKENEKKTKRDLIKDLILMKEIQTELEKEIGASLLSA